MAVTNISPQTEYIGNSLITDFTYNFEIDNVSDLNVSIGDVLQTNYTVDTNNKIISFVVAPSIGVVVTIKRDTKLERTTDYINGGGLNSDTLDKDFDKLYYILQDLSLSQTLLEEENIIYGGTF